MRIIAKSSAQRLLSTSTEPLAGSEQAGSRQSEVAHSIVTRPLLSWREHWRHVCRFAGASIARGSATVRCPNRSRRVVASTARGLGDLARRAKRPRHGGSPRRQQPARGSSGTARGWTGLGRCASADEPTRRVPYRCPRGGRVPRADTAHRVSSAYVRALPSRRRRRDRPPFGLRERGVRDGHGAGGERQHLPRADRHGGIDVCDLGAGPRRADGDADRLGRPRLRRDERTLYADGRRIVAQQSALDRNVSARPWLARPVEELRPDFTFTDSTTPLRISVPDAWQLLTTMCGAAVDVKHGLVTGRVTMRGDTVPPSGLGVVGEWAESGSDAAATLVTLSRSAGVRTDQRGRSCCTAFLCGNRLCYGW